MRHAQPLKGEQLHDSSSFYHCNLRLCFRRREPIPIRTSSTATGVRRDLGPGRFSELGSFLSLSLRHLPAKLLGQPLHSKPRQPLLSLPGRSTNSGLQQIVAQLLPRHSAIPLGSPLYHRYLLILQRSRRSSAEIKRIGVKKLTESPSKRRWLFLHRLGTGWRRLA